MDTDELMNRGYEECKVKNYEAALSTGEQLIERGHTSGFEIAALASAGLDDRDRAIQFLERGIEIGPSVWLLWHLLANYYSDEGRYDDARDSYQKALECKKVDKSCVFYNWALVELRDGNPSRLLKKL
jgi:tetratricopeptide (TPR) repeat protein